MGKKVTAPVVLEKRITVSGNRLPDPIPDGEILCDVKGNQWKIGRSIGFGGFGEIYLGSEYPNHGSGRCNDSNSQYVIKVEPHSSSTLFVEMNFYLRVATQDKVKEWTKYYNQNFLGIPHLVSFGSHFFHEKLRYLVLPRYGCDVQKKFYELGRRLHAKTAFTLCYYIIDALEYIHSHGYIHNDIKASNLVLGLKDQAPVYLMDFGLACRFIDKDTGLHKPDCDDERRAHNGTLEYTSRDGHRGALSRKGDLEILGYNLLQWLVGYLPWEINLSDPDRVALLKNRAMQNVKEFVCRCYMKDSPPDALIDYFKYINSLKFDSTPDYKYCKKLFRLGVQQSGFRFDKVLSFDGNAVPLSKVKSIKRLQCEIENVLEESPRKIFIANNSTVKTPEFRIPCNVQDFNRITRHSASESQIKKNKKFDWVRVLQSNPEMKIRSLNKDRQKKIMLEKSCDNLASCDELINTLKLNNPTYAMLHQMDKMRQRQLAEQNVDNEAMDVDEPGSNSNNNNKRNKKSTRKYELKTIIESPKKVRSKVNRKISESKKSNEVNHMTNKETTSNKDSKKKEKSAVTTSRSLKSVRSSSALLRKTNRKCDSNISVQEETPKIKRGRPPKRLQSEDSSASNTPTKKSMLNVLNKKLMSALSKLAISGEIYNFADLKQIENAPRSHRSEGLKRTQSLRVW